MDNEFEQSQHIYSSIEVPIEDLSIEKKDILKYLKDRANIPITANKICVDLKLKKSKTEVGLRKAITELIEIDKEPIVSCSKGFFYTNDKKEIEKYISHLNLRIQGIDRRINALNTILQNGEN